MSSSEVWRCDRCDADVAPADWPYGICPRCLVAEEYSEAPTTPIASAASTISRSPRDSSPSERIGPYKILRRLGEGGMGVVYLAQQDEPIRRRVALKLIKLGMDTRQVLVRFEAERQALALMNHPSIAHVHDAGMTDHGRPFFAMEYVKGGPITTYCDRHRLTTAERLELFMQVCDGVQHAHQRGIIHRDIKPANVLVTIQDDHPVPKIIDFGVAKATEQRLTEQTMFTQQGMLIGTPEYMSPEQAELTALDVDTRTDVYSLGVLLYELLVGAPPFGREDLYRAGFDEIRRLIREVTPPKPSTRLSTLGKDSEEVAGRRNADPRILIQQCTGDLDWITMKALEKDRTRRYATPLELAADVRRHLADEPVQASPPDAVYRVKKFVRRHRLGVIAAGLIGAALILGAVVASVGLVQSIRSERKAKEHAARATREAETASRVSDFLVELFEEADPDRALGEDVTVREVLDRAAARLEQELVDEPLVRARLLNTIGIAYVRLGLIDEPLPYLEEALAIRLELLGELNLETADSLISLGRLYDFKRDFEKELDLLQRGLAVREKLLGPDHLDVAEPLSMMAGEMPGKDLEYRERALAIMEKHLGPEDPKTYPIRNDLALSLSSRGRTEQARALHEKNIVFAEARGLNDDPSIMLSLHSLASIHLNEGNLAEALRLAEQAQAISLNVYKNEHPYWSSGTLELVGNIYRKQGDTDSARPLLEQSLEISESVLGAEHEWVVTRRWRLAAFYIEIGERSLAEPMLQQCLRYWEERLGEGSGRLAFIHASYFALTGDRDQAIQRLQQAMRLGFTNAKAIAGSPYFSVYSGDPEFEAIVDELRGRSEED